jgi:deoxyribonuclease-4
MNGRRGFGSAAFFFCPCGVKWGEFRKDGSEARRKAEEVREAYEGISEFEQERGDNEEAVWVDEGAGTMSGMPPLGTHVSIAGGVDNAPGRAAGIGCTAMQIFVKNNNRWEGPPITAEKAERFKVELKKANIPAKHVFAHTCYLINLASPKKDVLDKSLTALEDELRRCDQIGVPGLVMHPGAHLGTGRDTGIQQVAEMAAMVFERIPGLKTRLLIETTAGTGTNLGARFEDLAEILGLVDDPAHIGVCLDTCHIFAAGYDIRTPDAYEKTMKEFDRVVGFRNLHAIHVNDSKMPFNSRKDRHEHIGQGEIGEEAFRSLMRDERLRHIPMSLETDKDEAMTEDVMNLGVLRRLAGEDGAA